MTQTVTRDQWLAVRSSVNHTADLFADLVRSAPDPRARATRHWSIADTAAHVLSVAALHTSTLPGAGAPDLPVPDLAERVRTATVDTVSALNEVVLAHLTERNPQVLAERLRTQVDQLLRLTESMDPVTTVAWLGDSRVPVAGLLAHMLNELSIHGRDIARTVSAPWTIPPQDAATFIELFLVGVIQHGYGRLMDRPEPPPPGRIAVHFRSAYTTPVTMVLHDGQVSIADPADPVDVRVSFDPTILTLMMFGRVSKARAVLTGKVVIGGRRPWKLPTFLGTVRMPS